ncbi:MAG: hypothetical protein PHV63_02400 [Candidatus Daviesbacteria bacterium]|nr:hypothetical protein [Candidatus Daviesbacteria bacterium]
MHHAEQGNLFEVFCHPNKSFTLADIGNTPFGAGDGPDRQQLFAALMQPGIRVTVMMYTNDGAEQLAPDTYTRCISTGYYLLGCWQRGLDTSGSYRFNPDPFGFRPEEILTGSCATTTIFTSKQPRFNDKGESFYRIYQLYCVRDADNLR